MSVALSGGEIGSALYARVDLPRYQTCLRTCLNWWVQPYGGAKNRSGTKYVATTKTDGEKVRLIPFQFSSDQGYVLEMGNKYMRIFRNGVPLYDSLTATTENFGTGDGAELHFHLAVSAVDVAPVDTVTIYANAVEMRQADSVNLLTAPDDATNAAWTKTDDTYAQVTVVHHNAGPGNIYDSITWNKL